MSLRVNNVYYDNLYTIKRTPCTLLIHDVSLQCVCPLAFTVANQNNKSRWMDVLKLG